MTVDKLFQGYSISLVNVETNNRIDSVYRIPSIIKIGFGVEPKYYLVIDLYKIDKMF